MEQHVEVSDKQEHDENDDHFDNIQHGDERTAYEY